MVELELAWHPRRVTVVVSTRTTVHGMPRASQARVVTTVWVVGWKVPQELRWAWAEGSE